MIVGGAVLCGGDSRRMGRDKALIDIGGLPMAEHVARILEAAGCDPVVFVGGDSGGLAATGRRVVPDRWPGAGPVGGVLAALGDVSSDAVVVCACDLVDLTADAVRAVIGPDSWSTGCDVRVADSGRLEPMLACWWTGAGARIEQRFTDGVTALHDIVDSLGAVRVPVDPTVMRNVNSPADLRIADRPARR